MIAAQFDNAIGLGLAALVIAYLIIVLIAPERF